MKTYLLSFALCICTFGLFAQAQPTTTVVKIGDVFEMGIPETRTYQHIDIPKSNIIRKRGGFFNQNEVYGSLVEVTNVKLKKDGTTTVTISPKDGTRFFGSHKYISADVNAALRVGELKAL